MTNRRRQHQRNTSDNASQSPTIATVLLRFLSYYSQERSAVVLGLTIRLAVAWALPILMDRTSVPYTDIDYHVFMDAARLVQNGNSPYQRHTYRYTPFLAALLAQQQHWLPIPNGGRYLFCLADTCCGWIILKLRRSSRLQTSTTCRFQEIQDAAWWLFNPLVINICTRGSAESLMVILPVLLTLQTLLGKDGRSPSLARACWAGTFHGLAVHCKLYPIIYTLSYMMHLASTATSTNDEKRNGSERQQQQQQNKTTNTAVQKQQQNGNSLPRKLPIQLYSLLKLWVTRLLLDSPLPLAFLASAIASFATLTHLAVIWYGNEALQEGFWYHLSRVDHRHNYSMFWYWIYLAKSQPEVITAASTSWWQTLDMSVLGRLLLLPQVTLLLVSSLGLATQNLSLALFLQTYLFVTFNKVITAQYFTWYLCWLPLCSDALQLTPRVQLSLISLAIAFCVWLSSAYCLEMQGMAFHRMVWLASVLFFGANVNVLSALLQSYRHKRDNNNNNSSTSTTALYKLKLV